MRTRTPVIYRELFGSVGTVRDAYRYCLEAMRNRFGSVTYFIMDAEKPDPMTGLAGVVAQWDSPKGYPAWLPAAACLPYAVWQRCVEAVERYHAREAIEACCAAVEARGYTVPPGHCGVDFESGKAYACSGATAGPGTYHDSALTVQSRREPDGTWSAPY